MKRFILLSAFVCLYQIGHSQVPKKVIVEHFTNTKCSICASRNPGFYTNYNAQTGVIHLAIHPSSPYSACVLSQHNAVENDARTNYYGIYGGTPRLVIQGVVVNSGANYGSASIFTPYLGQQSPASIKIMQVKYGNDSIRSRVVIKTEAAHSLPGLSLFVALAEDTINYTGSNGEPVHYDVFRKSLTGASGINITLPATIGDSVVYTKSSTVNGAWNFSRIFTLAVLQETGSKAVVQAQNISASSNSIYTGVSEFNFLKATINVYSSQKTVYVNQDKFIENLTFSIYDLSGRLLSNKTIDSTAEQMDLNHLDAGIYLYSIKSGATHVKTGKLLLQ
ncbi:MAG: T9SS type A sorting domain-containing protein [Sediminibacterium sp.]|nr:T9SS type A sorting domain-containing protein [Sediminibacterium sp.]